MYLKNTFSEKDRNVWLDYHECFYCGKNQPDCLHHIVGRGGPKGDCEDSIYNSAPLHNMACHIPIHGLLMKDFMKMKFLVRTKKYLDSIGYKPTNLDYRFLDKYKKFYGN